MNATRTKEATELMRTLSAESRLSIICFLCKHKTASVGDIVEAVGLEQSATSHQLARLKDEGLVVVKRQGQQMIYRLAENSRTKLAQKIIDECNCLTE